MPLIRRPFKRTGGFRDARLIVIATEGEETERLYFNALKAGFRKPSVQVEVLERSAG